MVDGTRAGTGPFLFSLQQQPPCLSFRVLSLKSLSERSLSGPVPEACFQFLGPCYGNTAVTGGRVAVERCTVVNSYYELNLSFCSFIIDYTGFAPLCGLWEVDG